MALVALLVAAIAVTATVRSRRRLDRIAIDAGSPAGGDAMTAVVNLRERAVLAESGRDEVSQDLDALVESLAQGVLTVADGVRITGANAAAYRLLARAPGSLPGRTLLEAFLDTQIEAIAISARDTGSSSGEVAVAGADGPRLVIRGRRKPSGQIWLVLEDVSELRRLQQIRTEFIDNLSHELRTPLTTVSLLAETLTREAAAVGDDAIPPKMRERIAKIEIETGHLVQMVSELLDLSRIESGGALGPLELLDLGPIVTESTERLRLFADRQGVVLEIAIEERLPPVRGDGNRLGQVLVNLLHNAVKFSPDGGAVRVSVRAAGRERRRRRRRPWGRDPAGCPGADLRALLQGGPSAGPGRDRRDRARPGDRPAHRRAARRPYLGRIRPKGSVARSRSRSRSPARDLIGTDEGARWTNSMSPP